jgi:hypothetical protein
LQVAAKAATHKSGFAEAGCPATELYGTNLWFDLVGMAIVIGLGLLIFSFEKGKTSRSGGRAAIQHNDEFSNFLVVIARLARVVMLGISRHADGVAG